MWGTEETQDSAWGPAVLGAMPGALQTAHRGGAHPAVPWLGDCSGALTFPAPSHEMLGPLHWEAQQFPHVQIPCVTHPRGCTLCLPLGLGMCRAFPQGSRKVLGTSWGTKALSQGCALGKFYLLALKASHFPREDEDAELGGLFCCCPSSTQRRSRGRQGLCSSTSSCTPAHSTQEQTSTQGSIKASLFPNGNDHPGDLEIQRSSVSKAIGFQKLRSKGPPGQTLQALTHTCNKGTSFSLFSFCLPESPGPWASSLSLGAAGGTGTWKEQRILVWGWAGAGSFGRAAFAPLCLL